ncbi:MAG TPA: cache and HAMP domain-containing protein [Candidatus Nanoarchaeia archaeon]|nr:cache and HAMP domain-containing protein [Candidatus Nanoarchaeia archaeon]
MELPLRVKLLISFSLVSILMVAVVAGLITWQTRNILSSKAEEDALRFASYTSELVDIYINNVRARMENLAMENEIISAAKTRDAQKLSRISDEFEVVVKTSPSFETLGLQTKDCVLLAIDRQGMGLVGRSFSERDYCKGAIGTKMTYVSGGFISAATGNPVLAISVPLYENNEMIGLLVASVKLPDLYEHLLMIQKGDHLVVLDRYGDVLIDTEGKLGDVLGSSSEHAKEKANLVNLQTSNRKTEGSFILEDEFIGFAKFDYVTIVHSQSLNAAFITLRQTIGIIIIAALIVLVLSVLLVWIVCKSISRPIEKISIAVEEITKGNFRVQLEKSSTKEIQSLVDSMNRVMASLKLAVLKDEKNRKK